MNNLKLARDDLNNIIEEKCPHTGVILNRYTKGRRLGKVFFYFIQREDSLYVMKSSISKITKSLLLKSSIRLH